MNDLQIEYFLAVARNLSFTKTAEEFYVTQPAVSRQISFLEKELDVALFDRTNKSTKLTEAGRLFQKYFADSKKSLARTKELARSMNSRKTGRVRVASLEGWNISGFFPQLLKLFSTNYPNIEISLETYGVRGLIRAVKTGRADLILTLGVTLKDTEGIEVSKLAEISQILLFSRKHPLADKPDLNPADFRDEKFFVMAAEEASYADTLVREYCRPYGFEPDIVRVRSIESMFSSVQNGMGVCICDMWSQAKDSMDFSYLRLDTKHEISLAWIPDSGNSAVNIVVNELAFLVGSREPVIVG